MKVYKKNIGLVSLKRLWSWGNSVSGGLRWLSQLLRIEIVWALELLSGNILSPDV